MKSSSRAGARPARAGVRGGVLGVAALLVGMSSAVLIPGTAAAAEIDAITGVQMDGDPSVPLHVFDKFTIRATWALPEDPQPQAGDTFTLSFPSNEFEAFASSFPLVSGDDEVGTCAVARTGITCTLTSFVESHTDIGGELWFEAQASRQTDVQDITLTTGTGVEFDLPVPGGGGVGPREVAEPDKLEKWGWNGLDGDSFEWRVFARADALQPTADGSPAVIVDRLDFDAPREEFAVAWFTEWNNGDYGPGATWLTPAEYTRTDDGRSTTITLVPPVRTEGWYVVSYSTPVPADAEPGDVYTNSVTLNGYDARTSQVRITDAGGSASGTVKRTIALTKRVEGDAPADARFEFTVSCTRDGQVVYTNTDVVTADATVLFGRVPVGTVCTLTEAEGSGAELELVPAGPIAVDADSPQVIEVVAVNTFPEVPEPTPSPSSSSVPVPSPSSSPEPTPTPTPTPSITVLSSTSGIPSTTPTTTSTTATPPPLARTGGISVVPLFVGLGALVLGGVALTLGRRRTSDHS